VTLLAFIAVGGLAAIAVLVLSIVVIACAVMLYAVAQSALVLAAILSELRTERVARAVARSRWTNALRGRW
jgi:hypothetical protein